MQGCSPESYIRELTNLLDCRSNDVKIITRKGRNGRVIGYDIKGIVHLTNSAELKTFLKIGYEKGLINKHNNRYVVRYYSYHYNHPEQSFRFDKNKNQNAHANDHKGNHLYYNKGLKLDTEDANAVIILNLCLEFERCHFYPLDAENWPHYNKLIRGIRRSLK